MRLLFAGYFQGSERYIDILTKGIQRIVSDCAQYNFFLNLSCAYNMVRVIKGKIIYRNDLKGSKNYFESTEGKITVILWKKSRGKPFWFELAPGYLEVKLAFLLHSISLFLVICFELPRTRPFFEFPSGLELSGVNCFPRWLNSRFFCCKCVNQNSFVSACFAVSGALPNKFVKPYGYFFSCAFPAVFVFGAGNSVSHSV